MVPCGHEGVSDASARPGQNAIEPGNSPSAMMDDHAKISGEGIVPRGRGFFRGHREGQSRCNSSRVHISRVPFDVCVAVSPTVDRAMEARVYSRAWNAAGFAEAACVRAMDPAGGTSNGDKVD